jgi:hypothetical protein
MSVLQADGLINRLFLSVYLSVCLFICLSVCLHSCCSHLQHKASVKRFVSLQFLYVRQSVGLFGRGSSLSQGRYIHRTTQAHNKSRQISIP